MIYTAVINRVVAADTVPVAGHAEGTNSEARLAAGNPRVPASYHDSMTRPGRTESIFPGSSAGVAIGREPSAIASASPPAAP